MNLVLFKKQVFELKEFFEKHPQKMKGLSVREYQNLLKGINFIIRNASENIDLKGISSVLKLAKGNNSDSVINQIDKRKESVKLPESLYYSEVEAILNFYLLGTEYVNDTVTNQDWLDLTGYLRPFEMERLSYNFK
jgi:hypothetical protein